MNHLANLGVGLLIVGVVCLAALNIASRFLHANVQWHAPKDIASIVLAVLEGLVVMLIIAGALAIAWVVGCGVLPDCSPGGSS